MCAHVQKIQRHVEKVEKLNIKLNKELSIDLVLNSFPDIYDQLILIYHLNNTETVLIEIHSLFQTVEAKMKKTHLNGFVSAVVMAI